MLRQLRSPARVTRRPRSSPMRATPPPPPAPRPPAAPLANPVKHLLTSSVLLPPHRGRESYTRVSRK